MQVGEHVGELHADGTHLFQWKTAPFGPLERVFERLSLDVLHYHIPVGGIGEMVIDTGKVAVGEPRKHTHLAIVRVGGLDDPPGTEPTQVDLFDCDQPVPPFDIPRFIDHAKAALADFGEDAIAICQ